MSRALSARPRAILEAALKNGTSLLVHLARLSAVALCLSMSHIAYAADKADRQLIGSASLGAGAGLTVSSTSASQYSIAPWTGVGLTSRRPATDLFLGVDNFIGYFYLPDGAPANAFMILMATTSVAFGGDAIRIGPYATLGLSTAGAGARAVWSRRTVQPSLPYDDRTVLINHGVELRAGLYLENHGHVSVAYRLTWQSR